ncbi:hypothetical protein B0H14DRAFT_2567422 [Mycena olivaceomarginata]|nr:hypothetical protein B0H14DRAFT_2567422 [Mycena olivaceomarginata]
MWVMGPYRLVPKYPMEELPRPVIGCLRMCHTIIKLVEFCGEFPDNVCSREASNQSSGSGDYVDEGSLSCCSSMGEDEEIESESDDGASSYCSSLEDAEYSKAAGGICVDLTARIKEWQNGLAEADESEKAVTSFEVQSSDSSIEEHASECFVQDVAVAAETAQRQFVKRILLGGFVAEKIGNTRYVVKYPEWGYFRRISQDLVDSLSVIHEGGFYTSSDTKAPSTVLSLQ